MISNSTVVFYKDTYDIIYIVDKVDYVNARDVEYTTTVLDPNIYGVPPAVKVQDGIIFKYGKIDIRKEVYSLAGGMGVFKEVSDPYVFVSDQPYFNPSHVGRQVTIRNVVRNPDKSHTLYIYNAAIEKVFNSSKILIGKVFQGAVVPPHIGAALISFELGYELNQNIIPSNYISFDFIRMTYDCNDNPTDCGSRVVPDMDFRFGPVDSFKIHLDSQPTDVVEAYVSDGHCWADVDALPCVWAVVDADGGINGRSVTSCPTEITGDANVVTWVDVWGDSAC